MRILKIARLKKAKTIGGRRVTKETSIWLCRRGLVVVVTVTLLLQYIKTNGYVSEDISKITLLIYLNLPDSEVTVKDVAAVNSITDPTARKHLAKLMTEFDVVTRRMCGGKVFYLRTGELKDSPEMGKLVRSQAVMETKRHSA